MGRAGRAAGARGSLGSIPVVFLGVVLISGVVGAGAYGDDPLLGVVYGLLTALAYALFLLILRQAERATCAARPGRCSTPRSAPRVFSRDWAGWRGRPRLGAGPGGAGVAGAAGAVLAGARLAADLGVAAAAAGGDHLDRAHAAAGGRGDPRGGAAVRGALRRSSSSGVAIVLAGVAVATAQAAHRGGRHEAQRARAGGAERARPRSGTAPSGASRAAWS